MISTEKGRKSEQQLHAGSLDAVALAHHLVSTVIVRDLRIAGLQHR